MESVIVIFILYLYWTQYIDGYAELSQYISGSRNINIEIYKGDTIYALCSI